MPNRRGEVGEIALPSTNTLYFHLNVDKRGQQLNLACCLFLYNLQAKNGFYRRMFAIHLMIGNTNFEPMKCYPPKKEIPFFLSVSLYYKQLYSNISIIICISSKKNLWKFAFSFIM